MTRDITTVDTLTDLPARTGTGTYTGDARTHTDADEMRREFGLPRYDREAFDDRTGGIVPDCLEHVDDREEYVSSGGTDFLCVGKPDAGKSTLAKYWAIRLLEANDEIVVWRASESRSEWLSFAPWARVCLPENADVEAKVRTTGRDGETRDVDLADVAREVVRYENPEHLNNELLTPGMVHIVYPDPTFTGCQELYERSPKTYDLEFQQGDPVKHWWIAWTLARVEYGPYWWTSLIFDEVGDVISQDAAKDVYSTYEKVLLYRDLYVDARKYGLSVFMFGHSETDIHEKLRRKVRWRITMNGIANPTRASQVVGVNNVPMRTDMTSRMKVGRALMWNEVNFDPSIAWKDIPNPCDEVLQVSLSPCHDRERAEETAPTAEEGEADDARQAATDGGLDVDDSAATNRGESR